MRTFSLLRGLPVLLSNGKKIGTVNDLCLSEQGEITGILLEKGLLLKKSVHIGLKQISSYGKDGIIVAGDAEIMEVQNVLGSKETLLGKTLLSNHGEQLGLIEDVYFHEELGTILGYECSDGFFTDILEGKQFVQANSPPAIGKDAIIVNIVKEKSYQCKGSFHV